MKIDELGPVKYVVIIFLFALARQDAVDDRGGRVPPPFYSVQVDDAKHIAVERRGRPRRGR